jgi:hypothetical protein
MDTQTARESEQKATFSLGRLVATPNALTAIPNEEILATLSRHMRGDWGTLDAEDWNANEHALLHGGRLFSSYRSTQNVKFYIITSSLNATGRQRPCFCRRTTE